MALTSGFRMGLVAGPIASDPVVSRLVNSLAHDAPRALKPIQAAERVCEAAARVARPPAIAASGQPGRAVPEARRVLSGSRRIRRPLSATSPSSTSR